VASHDRRRFGRVAPLFAAPGEKSRATSANMTNEPCPAPGEMMMDAFDRAYNALVKEQDKGWRRLHWLMLSMLLNFFLAFALAVELSK
jgi:hypothetical protein